MMNPIKIFITTEKKIKMKIVGQLAWLPPILELLPWLCWPVLHVVMISFDLSFLADQKQASNSVEESHEAWKYEVLVAWGRKVSLR